MLRRELIICANITPLLDKSAENMIGVGGMGESAWYNGMNMEPDDYTPEEAERRAGELARRLLTTPPRPHKAEPSRRKTRVNPGLATLRPTPTPLPRKD